MYSEREKNTQRKTRRYSGSTDQGEGRAPSITPARHAMVPIRMCEASSLGESFEEVSMGGRTFTMTLVFWNDWYAPPGPRKL
jgi:hypothetical protein